MRGTPSRAAQLTTVRQIALRFLLALKLSLVGGVTTSLGVVAICRFLPEHLGRPPSFVLIDTPSASRTGIETFGRDDWMQDSGWGHARQQVLWLPREGAAPVRDVPGVPPVSELWTYHLLGLPFYSVVAIDAAPVPDGDPGPYTSSLHRLAPLWNGLLLNAAVWVIAFQAALSTHGVAQSRWLSARRRRHLCARCAYPVADSETCPECGHHLAWVD